jgi:tRNA(Ile)-lysidine synthase
MAFEAEQRFLTPGRRVLAAVSGGPDSVCLAHWLSVQARKKGLTVALVHVHHGLRGRAADADPGSSSWAEPSASVAVSARRCGRSRRAPRLEGGGAQGAALGEKARRGRFTAVATGHQLDDQAETVLLHLLRGTSLEGLGGIPARRPLRPGVELIRPLLPLTRAEVILYLERNKLGWREDATNADPKFTRNWVRREVIPLLEERAPGVKERLAAIAAKVRAATGRG